MISPRIRYTLQGCAVHLLPALLALVCAWPQAALAEQAPAAPVDPGTQSVIDNLMTIQQSLDARRANQQELRKRLKAASDPAEALELEEEIAHNRSEIADLQQSFEHVATGNINLAVLADVPEQPINWRNEIEQISRPLLSSLKELTAKPRQIDSLTREIERRGSQLKVLDRALESIRSINTQNMPKATAEAVQELLVDWQQRREETQRALEISQLKLEALKSEGAGWWATTREAVAEFLHGRGLTLLLAIASGTLVWLLARLLRALYLKWLYRSPSDDSVTRAPLVLYSYRLATAILMVLAIMLVLYVRGDLLLLTLAGIMLVGAALALRQTLPRYTAEIRLLLGVGPVREKERLVLDGVPYRVESLSMYSVLRNPLLEGVKRLPLHLMDDYASRPASKEPWFPSRPDDMIMLPDGNVGKVLQQTIETVEISVRDTRVQYRTADFIGLNVRNLTREGFGVAASFGIDYRHQAICLDTVPRLFQEAIAAHLARAGFGADLQSIMVEFREAGSSSLDYQIYLILAGAAAGSFFKLQRIIQQACVDTCNREGWEIPFTQVTVHAAGGAAIGLPAPAAAC